MFVTLAFGRLEPSQSPGLAALHEWFDSWSGIGVIERGMARQGYDLQLTRYRSKGDRSPDQWKPENRAFWCQYGQSWATVKTLYQLETTEPERAALREMLATC